MSVTSKMLKRIGRIYSSRSFKKKMCLCVTVLFFFFLICFFFEFNIRFLCSLSFISFHDMPNHLLPRESGSQPINGNFCFHRYERQLSLEGIELNLNISDIVLKTFTNSSKNITIGGASKPVDCFSKYRVNIVVPYRRRPEQLRVFLHYLHRYLQLQEIDYRIIVVEQSPEMQFNRGKLFNIGFVESQKRFPSDCYIFHDVDLIPLSLNNIYACTKMPRHLSSAVDTFDYELPYCGIFGGAVAMTTQHFQSINGFSNLFYGWGGEDDDLYFRVTQAELGVVRFEKNVAKYKMLRHEKEVPNPNRFVTMKKNKIIHAAEGLNSLNYTMLSEIELKSLYTLMRVHL